MTGSFGIPEITLAVIIGTLAAIVYSLRILVMVDRRIERIEEHIESMVKKVMNEELKIERQLRGRKKK